MCIQGVNSRVPSTISRFLHLKDTRCYSHVCIPVCMYMSMLECIYICNSVLFWHTNHQCKICTHMCTSMWMSTCRHECEPPKWFSLLNISFIHLIQLHDLHKNITHMRHVLQASRRQGQVAISTLHWFKISKKILTFPLQKIRFCIRYIDLPSIVNKWRVYPFNFNMLGQSPVSGGIKVQQKLAMILLR